ncbi:hypothetical protein AB1Y20_022420 [Prymnesium parvum]|uniref:Spermatogenesis-associated protein 17 n=1 Tax=Prymnesium parvum TaxID=97485 RepID=A0AB34JG43_PRYPA
MYCRLHRQRPVTPRGVGGESASPPGMSVLLDLRGRAMKEIDEAFFEMTTAAEAARERETAACVRLQKVWRGRVLRWVLKFWTWHACLMERCARGYLGRLRSLRKQLRRDEERQRAFFEAHAIVIQLRFRGFYSRKYVHNFYARKAYVAAVLHKGKVLQKDLQQRLDEQIHKHATSVEQEGRQKVSTLAARLHHLRSTNAVPGMYNSPYHVGYHPTAFGVSIEDHLRSAIRPVVQKELLERSAKGLKPIQSLPPIKPQLSPGPYDSVKQGEREESWISKTKRVSPDDFLPPGRSELRYQSSVHINAGYHPPPTHLEREVDKSKWVTQKGFVSAVPSDRLVSSGGSQKAYLD